MSAAARPTFTGKASIKFPTGLSVYEAALERIRWLYDEFGSVTVSTSGGKDSTVVLELALIVARERNALPLTVMWLDQECEFEATVAYQRAMADRPEIDFRWYQVPFLLFNATNHDDPWLRCWDPDEEEIWVREKETDSIHVNPYVDRRGKPIDRFKALLNEINADAPGVMLTGMRVEESPARRMTMTSQARYKWITWASLNDTPDGRSGLTFHPIYDWNTTDVWKAIEDHGWLYNAHYDHQYNYGVARKDMRVSNYHHETALPALHHLQEIEPETWEKATRRLEGINAYGHLRNDQIPRTLPYMFASWEEYLFYLIANLTHDPDHWEKYLGYYESLLRSLPDQPREKMAQAMTRTVVINDVYGTSVKNLIANLRGRGLDGKVNSSRKENS